MRFRSLFNKEKTDMETIACPFCGGDQWVAFRKGQNIVTCSSCGVTYLRYRPTQEAMYEIYQRYASDTSHMRLPATVGEAKQAGLRRKPLVDEITGLHHPAPRGRWLDVGCGWGALLDEVRDRGYTPGGIELTRNCLDFASLQLGIPVSNSQLLDARIDSHSHSVVSMVHVLEHLPYPRQALARVHDILEEGGLFCGIVPNIESLCAQYQKDDWVWLDPVHHYVHYSPATLAQALQKAGFIIVKMYTAIGDYDYQAVIDCMVRNIPAATTPEAARALIPEWMEKGKGEEIRFFARK